jgi:hypothetical protein
VKRISSLSRGFAKSIRGACVSNGEDAGDVRNAVAGVSSVGKVPRGGRRVGGDL